MKPLKEWPWAGMTILLVVILLTAVAAYSAGRVAGARALPKETP